ncbi:hypothetical protein [Lentibacillus sp. CBA3610]|uniref:hypothetical protein n=1 Tax=Lentibacillus sp. CBA3610 TaxID=2518176 RepID=UPI00159618E0|nr:hypothetical protein [Lentibacillus sp. CBA3610]QKY70261.1 hypothetical protein Len3610_12220 [Lentibacillus sp. CBA3610]
MKRLYEVNLSHDSITPYQAKISDLRHLIREEEIDEIVSKKFPLEKCGEMEELLKIKGTRSLLEGFNQIDCIKFDIIASLDSIRLAGFSESQMVLEFSPDRNIPGDRELLAEGIYSFTYDFLEYNFSMGKFSNYCLENQHLDLLEYNTNKLLREVSNKTNQYRILKADNDNYFIRAHTSTRYKNYDNHLAIYLALYSVNIYAKRQRTTFRMNKAYITDSDLYIFIEQENPFLIKQVGYVYFGIMIKNNELADGALTIDFRFRVHSDEGMKFSVLQEQVLSISHAVTVSNISNKLENLNRFADLRNNALNLINVIKKSPYLSEDNLYDIFKKIIYSKTAFSKETKERVKEIKETLNNTYTIINLFDRLGEITTDIEERLHLERIYDNALKNHAKGNK